jgi:long-chain acyl-CoA synthetase
VDIINLAKKRRGPIDNPIIESESRIVYFADILSNKVNHLSRIKEGDVVGLIGDFDSQTLLNLLFLIQKNAIIIPLSPMNRIEHEGFLEICKADWIVENISVEQRPGSKKSELIEKLQIKKNPGLILFSSGSTGKPKAILHDFSIFFKRFDVPSSARKTLNFLLFDHIGGLNTFFHTLFNSGTVVPVVDRSPFNIISVCNKHKIELLPTTPTFLRMLLYSGISESDLPDSLKIITYGTERMQQATLDQLCKTFTQIDFRQTYGLSEIGILKIRSENRESLFIKIGGDGVEVKTVNNELMIKTPTKMIGYLNEDSPFDSDGWYRTGDIVETKGEYLKIIGRVNDVINVGGLKFLPSEIETIALKFGSIDNAKATAQSNPITGHHVKLIITPSKTGIFDLGNFKEYLKSHLPKHKVPSQILIKDISFNHRFKQI